MSKKKVIKNDVSFSNAFVEKVTPYFLSFFAINFLHRKNNAKFKKIKKQLRSQRM